MSEVSLLRQSISQTCKMWRERNLARAPEEEQREEDLGSGSLAPLGLGAGGRGAGAGGWGWLLHD